MRPVVHRLLFSSLSDCISAPYFEVGNCLLVLNNYELLWETRKKRNGFFKLIMNRFRSFELTLLLTRIKMKLFWVLRVVAN